MAADAVRRPTDAPHASPEASSQLAADALNEQPHGRAETTLPDEVIAGIGAALGDIDFALCVSPEEDKILRARTCSGDGEGATQRWSGTVYLRPRVGQVAGFVDRLLADLNAGQVSRAALLAPTDLTAPWFHRVLADDRLSVVVLEGGRSLLQPGGVADEHPACGGAGLFVFGPGLPPEAFFEAVGNWGHVLLLWSHVRPAATTPPKGSLQAVLRDASRRHGFTLISVPLVAGPRPASNAST